MMLEIILISLTIFYFGIAFCLLSQWLDLIQKDNSRDAKKFLSKLLLVLATLLWPLVVPLAYIELLLNYKRNKAIIELVANQILEENPDPNSKL